MFSLSGFLRTIGKDTIPIKKKNNHRKNFTGDGDLFQCGTTLLHFHITLHSAVEVEGRVPRAFHFN